MRDGEPPVAAGTQVELFGAADGRVGAYLWHPEGAAAGRGELLLGRDDDGRWAVEGWWAEPRARRRWPFAAMHTGLGELEPAEVAALLDELGYDGVACGLGQAAALRIACEPRGQDVWSSYATLDLGRESGGQLEAIEDEMRALAGGPGEIWLAIRADGQPADIDAEARRAIGALARAARVTGVELRLYPHTGFWLATTEQAVALTRGTDPRRVGVCFNLCHFLRRDDAPPMDQLLQRSAPLISSVTINGADVAGSDWSALIQPLDAGDHDVGALLDLLDAIGFDGPVGLQGFGIALPPEVHLARSMETWRAAGR